MKVKYKLDKSYGNVYTLSFEIIAPISKKQFKELVENANYNRFKRCGIVKFQYTNIEKASADFVALIESINSDKKEYKIEMKKAKKDTSDEEPALLTFEEYCWDFPDIDPALMSDSERKEHYKDYLEVISIKKPRATKKIAVKKDEANEKLKQEKARIERTRKEMTESIKSRLARKALLHIDKYFTTEEIENFSTEEKEFLKQAQEQFKN